eukprot:TRINITY_DN12295_c0_g1_i5.p1 TRINITY_DN12295_c0_g1~~TRINITY_DN12295_c0_g1_i5.p1  ORF type:complete len:406 (+),score=57.54 TRINITY_DN12295_c0_g1_i5:395-1612(+)
MSKRLSLEVDAYSLDPEVITGTIHSAREAIASHSKENHPYYAFLKRSLSQHTVFDPSTNEVSKPTSNRVEKRASDDKQMRGSKQLSRPRDAKAVNANSGKPRTSTLSNFFSSRISTTYGKKTSTDSSVRRGNHEDILGSKREWTEMRVGSGDRKSLGKQAPRAEKTDKQRASVQGKTVKGAAANKLLKVIPLNVQGLEESSLSKQPSPRGVPTPLAAALQSPFAFGLKNFSSIARRPAPVNSSRSGKGTKNGGSQGPRPSQGQTDRVHRSNPDIFKALSALMTPRKGALASLEADPRRQMGRRGFVTPVHKDTSVNSRSLSPRSPPGREGSPRIVIKDDKKEKTQTLREVSERMKHLLQVYREREARLVAEKTGLVELVEFLQRRLRSCEDLLQQVNRDSVHVQP